jgi:Mrp family chromosome partitioning ATPase
VPSDARVISRAIVTNIPAFPKKLPIVLIATLATLMISSGIIVGSELLRLTAPHVSALISMSQRTMAAEADLSRALSVAPPPAPPTIPSATTPPPPRAWHPGLAAPVTEIAEVAAELRLAGDRAKKITMIGVGQNESVTLTALTLARLLARHAKVVLVELSISSPTLGAVSHDPMAPGVSDLMLGTATFGQTISKDRLSQVHLVGAGRASKDRSLLQSPRLGLAIDALLQAYDHVVLDAGTAADLPAVLLSSNAHAVVIPDPIMNDDARRFMCEQLRATGFLGVTMLSGPADPLEDQTPSIAAA